METAGFFGAMRVVGGNVAIDFVNTRSGPRDGEPDLESLRSYGDLVAWAGQSGLLTGEEATRIRHHARRDPDNARSTFQRAVDLRAVLDDLFRAISKQQQPPERALRVLASAEAEAIAHAVLVEGASGFDWQWRDDDLGRPLWPAIHAATELLTTGKLDRLKGCGGCRFLFIDETRNGSRRWCSMDDCGTAEKIRNFVARRAARRRAARRSAERSTASPRN
jgi:predicted RNA-binding Zn ribbon-like protein